LLSAALNQAWFAGAQRTASLAFSPHGAVPDLPGEVADLPGPLVYHLFGRSSPAGDYAISDEDHLEFLHRLQTSEYRPARLFDELRQHHLLFIGCRFPDWLARFFIRTVTNQRLRGPRETSGFVADSEAVSDSRLSLFLRGVQTEIYPPGDPVAFVAELYRRWWDCQPGTSGSVSSAGPAEEITIFLSYAREDVAAVQRLKQALDQAGLDAWFDQSELKGGDAWEQKIKTNIRQCLLFVPVISQTTVHLLESYFRREWNWALERAEGMGGSRPFIVPVIVDDTVPGVGDVPELFWHKQRVSAPGGELADVDVVELRNKVRQVRQSRGRSG
jgi:hypothetical protein